MPEYVVGRLTTLHEEVWVEAGSPEEAIRTAYLLGAFPGHGRETVEHHAFPVSLAQVVPFRPREARRGEGT